MSQEKLKEKITRRNRQIRKLQKEVADLNRERGNLLRWLRQLNADVDITVTDEGRQICVWLQENSKEETKETHDQFFKPRPGNPDPTPEG